MTRLFEIDPSCIPSHFTRVVYLIPPEILVRLGPTFQEALDMTVLSLHTALSKDHPGIRHFGTAYSIRIITIVLDIVPDPSLPSDSTTASSSSSSSSNRTEILHLRRGRQRQCQLLGFPDPGLRLRARVDEQIAMILKRHPEIETPILCSQYWDGGGAKDSDTYKRLVEAGASWEKWGVHCDKVSDISRQALCGDIAFTDKGGKLRKKRAQFRRNLARRRLGVERAKETVQSVPPDKEATVPPRARRNWSQLAADIGKMMQNHPVPPVMEFSLDPGWYSLQSRFRTALENRAKSLIQDSQSIPPGEASESAKMMRDRLLEWYKREFEGKAGNGSEPEHSDQQ
ncbi:hypothetical protein BU24DRAFT_254131 [Aaosphaeria arxii CBS 175.79]|uniref:Uncharacterized protein n=1 Tax=Aaosphaeria arxii CBS 175.79 TaxID=1450172 RepID=A0A6A5XIA1_9PLEO|nr:uncharacterized protein BU24DRAFT_254131 [Aaosphaeria arxii CBS 175.79]KAF2012551.1 hypothetical protein BU24DRAFT_254131 [Aaosphaeria arxii CBS 175.79]